MVGKIKKVMQHLYKILKYFVNFENIFKNFLIKYEEIIRFFLFIYNKCIKS